MGKWRPNHRINHLYVQVIVFDVIILKAVHGSTYRYKLGCLPFSDASVNMRDLSASMLVAVKRGVLQARSSDDEDLFPHSRSLG